MIRILFEHYYDFLFFSFPYYFVLPQITELCTTIPTILSHSLNRAPQVMNSFTQLFIHWPKKVLILVAVQVYT